jgi:hypothetical protein
MAKKIATCLSGFPAKAYWFLTEPLDSHVSQYGELENPGEAENPRPRLRFHTQRWRELDPAINPSRVAITAPSSLPV